MKNKKVCCRCCENLVAGYCLIKGLNISNDLDIDRKVQCSGEFKRIGKVRFR